MASAVTSMAIPRMTSQISPITPSLFLKAVNATTAVPFFLGVRHMVLLLMVSGLLSATTTTTGRPMATAASRP